MSFVYDFSVKDIRGNDLDFSSYRGKVLLIVNTASQCGFTPQFAGLEALYQKYKDQGLVVVGFPCNQFGQQDPGSASEIAQFCQINYGVTFPMMAKVDVNGPDASPLWVWLKQSASGVLGTEAIKWNFTKFLVGGDGKVIDRYGSVIKPQSLEADIEAALQQLPGL
ncbi:Hydroperoxy fatty acid reductase gpx1 [Saezia sanguinis]|uniref:Glutathione peroxidase n=1 Tax=Saezia sanguinis TaxID=1965230 RepID=A0A433SEB8_9BURK|nr:glutathione peroxidase [Saezia sanguinis]RUS67083.1 Hydroperoxy fatty acid reductase gpx1 [Saezia sanguinis]